MPLSLGRYRISQRPSHLPSDELRRLAAYAILASIKLGCMSTLHTYLQYLNPHQNYENLEKYLKPVQLDQVKRG